MREPSTTLVVIMGNNTGAWLVGGLKISPGFANLNGSIRQSTYVVCSLLKLSWKVARFEKLDGLQIKY